MTTKDVIGTEIAGVLKNIAALAIGIVEGLDLGDNIKGFLFASIINDIVELGRKVYNVNPRTLLGPACLGDAVITSFSNKSRNKLIGLLLAKKAVPLETKNNFLVEGLRNIEYIKKRSEEAEFHSPFVDYL